MRDTALDSWDAHHVPITNALPVPPRAAQIDLTPPRAVTATIRWATGPETITTLADAWHGRAILVELLDPRSRVRGIWLPIEDVQPVTGERYASRP